MYGDDVIYTHGIYQDITQSLVQNIISSSTKYESRTEEVDFDYFHIEQMTQLIPAFFICL